ncbi:uncharacterized protein LOC129959236 [Argiope bruennichi]|uniref:uncharacterized protein LOC129959236 n=1 Tax=Argiope bruennichi TaxID=94029 RepID=UPI0024941EA6|nr:uncharacterized protein LOC129959236 [Argiope bruennichi]
MSKDSIVSSARQHKTTVVSCRSTLRKFHGTQFKSGIPSLKLKVISSRLQIITVISYSSIQWKFDGNEFNGGIPCRNLKVTKTFPEEILKIIFEKMEQHRQSEWN